MTNQNILPTIASLCRIPDFRDIFAMIKITGSGVLAAIQLSDICLKNVMLRFLLSGFLFLPASGIRLAAQAPDTVKTTPRYFLIFSARSFSLKPFSIGGHAFVSWGREAKDSTVIADKTYGFYPKKGSNILDVVTEIQPGRVVEGYKKNSNGKRVKQLVVGVDAKTWQTTLSQAEGWEGSRYNLFYNNCVDFMDYIADQATLCTPKTTSIFGLPRNPVKYIKKVWRRNKKCTVRLHNLHFDRDRTKHRVILLGPQGIEEN